MALPDQLLYLSIKTVERRNGSYVIEIPKAELHYGALQEGETYRVVLLTKPELSTMESESVSQEISQPPTHPVKEGDIREVTIEDFGEQGDGIARVERGYVVIVPEVEIGDEVTVKITEARANVAFANTVADKGDNE